MYFKRFKVKNEICYDFVESFIDTTAHRATGALEWTN